MSFRHAHWAAAALGLAAAAAPAATFDVLETDTRSDGATGVFELPAGVSEAGAAATVPAITTGTVTDLNAAANGSAAFGDGDMVRVFGGIGAGADDVRFEVSTAFRVTLAFLSNASAANQPAFLLFAGTAPGTTPLFDVTPAGAVPRTSPVVLGGQSFAAGTYVLRVDGDAGVTAAEAYDLAIAPAPIPLPAGGALLVGGLAGLAALRRRAPAAAQPQA